MEGGAEGEGGDERCGTRHGGGGGGVCCVLECEGVTRRPAASSCGAEWRIQLVLSPQEIELVWFFKIASGQAYVNDLATFSSRANG